MTDARRDDNRVTTLLGVSSVDGITPIPLEVNPATGRLLVEITGSGAGDVVGPASATDNEIVRFDGVTGKLIQNSGIVTLGDTGTFSSSAEMAFDDVNKAGSTFAGLFKLSETNLEWNTFEINFGEVSLIDALNQAFVAGASDLATVLALGNTSGGTDIEMSLGDDINATGHALNLTTTTSGDIGIASAGNINLIDVWQVASTYAPVLLLSAAAAEWNTFEINFGEVSILNAINQAFSSGGGEDLAATLLLGNTTGGTNIEVTAGDVITATSTNLTLTTTVSGDIVLSPASGLVTLADDILLSFGTSNDASIQWDTAIVPDGLLVTTALFVVYNGSAEIIRMTNGGLFSQMYPGSGDYLKMGSGAATTNHGLNSNDDVFIVGELEINGTIYHDGFTFFNAGTNHFANDSQWNDGGTIIMGTGSDFSMEWNGTAQVLDATAGDLILQTTTSGDVQLLPLTDLVISDGNKAASTFLSELILSDASSEWDTFEVNFGEVSLLNAINQASAGGGGNTLDQAYDQGGGGVGRAITADTGAVTITVPLAANNAGLEITQNNTTNDPNALTVTNAANGIGVEINQTGVLASSKYGFHVYSNAAQVTQELIRFHQDNAASTANLIEVINDGTGTGVSVQQVGVLAAGGAVGALSIYSNSIQVNSPLFMITQDHATSSANTMDIVNDGTGGAIYIQQNGVLNGARNCLEVVSTAIQTVAGLALVYFGQKNASTTSPVFGIENDGSGGGMLIQQDGAVAAGTRALSVFSTNAQATASEFVRFSTSHASSTADVLLINNGGVGNDLNITHAVNSATAISGIKMDLANAGAGLEHAFDFNGSEFVSAAVGGTQNRKIRIKVGGTVYYIPAYTT